MGKEKTPAHTHACQWQISRHMQKSQIYCEVRRHIHCLHLGFYLWLSEFFRRVIVVSSFFLFVINTNNYSRSKCTASEKPGRKCSFTELCDYIQKHQRTSLNMPPSYTQKYWLKRPATGQNSTAAVMRHDALESGGGAQEKRLLGRHREGNLLSDVLESLFHSPAHPRLPRGLK